ncbi:MAG: sensor histidine kinase [Dysosmobacter sp.]
MLDNPDLSQEDRRSLLEDVKQEAQWLIRTVENLLSITRIGSDRTELNKQLEPVEEVLAEAVQKARKRLPDIKFSVEVPAELLMVPMDPILIEQVLSNLIENAVIHGKTTTAIHLQAEKTEDNFAAFFRSGQRSGHLPGPPAPLIRLFYPPCLSPTGDGKRNMGLGLSVCSAVVKAHGGRLTAHNHPDGAEFIFCLPMPPADPAISTDLSEEETL